MEDKTHNTVVVPKTPTIHGLFEIHVTVRGGGGNIDHFKATCKELGYKVVLIELPYGQCHEQLMTSSWISKVSDVEAIEKAKENAEGLKKLGFDILRVKVEAVSSNKGVPVHGPPSDPTLYFEFHVKLQLNDAGAEERVGHLIAPHKGHLSRNSLKGQPNIKFVTLRIYDKGREASLRVLDAVLSDLRGEEEETGRVSVLAVHREFAVFDTNIHLDKGWIDVVVGEKGTKK
jgi:hypothetical protein